ncbi:MAG TPA: hypothetical protein DDW94_06690 [Deltaproteobacteria bacterium]|nr:MAG: hypothetical protein A2Z79_01220 [Deltaproteobacteria bacterium GWA2_55_82]OGQ62087.1 MAG: hypothetical protein A3I81_03985 [Deltaproteobacteria bacterium RIFCSPLOWO2_02_FULL_55_12]OIJ74053.1 MAG: hypothetical protein A2V21_307130 [Deltaproteobacteria bacterium GWC2_55_46]HBG46664.1 hypothetical protein [Deltaproteobacteria bacterium]HCY11328.1 hypothetical protein [Deltaproteobacteria bacterium]
MKKFSLVEFSVEHPKLVVAIVALITLGFLTQFPKIKTDTNPKNMLPPTSDVRVWNDEVDETFALYEDTIVVGIENDEGVLNERTLGKVLKLTEEVLLIDGVAARDVNGLPTITNVTAEAGTLKVGPLMAELPKSEAEIERLKKDLFENPLFTGRVISDDGKTTAIYIPLEEGANGKAIADRIREVVKKEGGPEKYYVAGDPVARDTFGAEMFKLMAIFAPIAGMVMLIIRYLMFKDLFLSITLMMDAMMSIVWSMGALIILGFPVHIMSSMAPVFLMAIATDSIHIFNEFYFRYREKREKKAAIIETMKAVGRPVRYTALATAIGFGVLIFMDIVPVKVFGAVVAFGTVALRLLSFSFIPAMFTFVKEKNLEKVAAGEETSSGRASGFLKGLASAGAKRPLVTAVVGLVLFGVSAIGISRVVVNNNMVEWFKADSDIRTADSVLNASLGGTSLGYIVATAGEDDYIKDPEAMRFIEGLQRRLETLPAVGKTSSVVDYVKRINLVLHDGDQRFDRVPSTKDEIGQYLFLFSMSAKPSDLDNVVDYPFRKANIWMQLKTWDAEAMRSVIKAADEYKLENPTALDLKPAGIAYFNLVWNDEVLWDMLKGFTIALVMIFVILSFNFGSVKWAAIGYTPLLFTILLIYGAVGYLGKDFDMPIAVLSCLSLGMSVDFSIHFISRLRQRLKEACQGAAPSRESLTDALVWTAARPGKGIMRNAVLFASAFSVMLFAPLTPYITVGAFIVSMMLISATLTMVGLPALIMLFRGRLFRGN